MSLRLWCLVLTLALYAAGPGCSPTAETQLDEQQNPHFKAGREKLSSLDYKGAIESFDRALEDNPRSALAHFELGVLFEQHANDYAAALYHYNKALKLRPNGNPAENIRQRIPGCKQELLKADSLAIVNPAALRETESLRAENLALRRQIESLQAHLAGRPPAGASGAQVARAREVSSGYPSSVPANTASTNPAPRVGGGSALTGAAAGDADRARLAAPGAGRTRTHAVKAGETPFGISRQYRIKLDALLSANPGLDPRRIRVGQVLNIPAS
jgi:tetratricopeptide (TPR) repeat protein